MIKQQRKQHKAKTETTEDAPFVGNCRGTRQDPCLKQILPCSWFSLEEEDQYWPKIWVPTEIIILVALKLCTNYLGHKDIQKLVSENLLPMVWKDSLGISKFSFPLQQWFSTYGLQRLWKANNPFTGVIYQIFCISGMHSTIHNRNKIIVMK